MNLSQNDARRRQQDAGTTLSGVVTGDADVPAPKPRAARPTSCAITFYIDPL